MLRRKMGEHSQRPGSGREPFWQHSKSFTAVPGGGRGREELEGREQPPAAVG